MTIIIPIGVECAMADFLKRHNLRTSSFPFDWNISYNGVSKCIEDNFKVFTEPLINRINEYDIYFHHDFENIDLIDKDKEKYIRRCERLKKILETSNDDIIFIRRGHAKHHHHEHNNKYFNITNDINDLERLDKILSTKYPNLKYKLILVLVCGNCFKLNEIYKSNSDKIEIYNAASPELDDQLIENCCRKIFNV